LLTFLKIVSFSLSQSEIGKHAPTQTRRVSKATTTPMSDLFEEVLLQVGVQVPSAEQQPLWLSGTITEILF
jgi:hypothetical protein